MLQAILFLIPIILAFFSPLSAIAIMSYIYVLRIAINTEAIDCLEEACIAESDPLFGAALPLIVFLIIIFKIFIENKGIVKYNSEFTDYIFIFLGLIMLVGCLYSPDLDKSVVYLAKFISLGASFFYVTKLALYNNLDYEKEIQNFVKTIYIISILMAILGIYYYAGGSIFRMSLPGSHPIPYSLLIGQGFLISLAIFFTKGKIIGNDSYLLTSFNLFMIFFLLFSQFLTNTRGVTIAMILSSAIMIIFNFNRIGLFKVLISIPLGFTIFVYILSNLDTNTLFARFNDISGDQSVNERTFAYIKGWELIGDNIWTGIGTNGFSYFASMPYPHSFFLELCVSFGLFGLIIGILFLYTIIKYTLLLFSKNGSDIKYQLFHGFMLFFFIEMMFSFTLWMHRGFYLSLASVTVLAHLLILEKNKLPTANKETA